MTINQEEMVWAGKCVNALPSFLNGIAKKSKTLVRIKVKRTLLPHWRRK
jgi:hypothetical protein